MPYFLQPGNNNFTFDISKCFEKLFREYIYSPRQYHGQCALSSASLASPSSPGSPGHGPLATFLGDRLASSTHLPPPSRTLPVSSWCIFRHQRYLISSTTSRAAFHADSAYQPQLHPPSERGVQPSFRNRRQPIIMPTLRANDFAELFYLDVGSADAPVLILVSLKIL
jgi:hypothetical protein